MTSFFNKSVNLINGLWFILLTILIVFVGFFPIKLFAQETISKNTLHLKTFVNAAEVVVVVVVVVLVLKFKFV